MHKPCSPEGINLKVIRYKVLKFLNALSMRIVRRMWYFVYYFTSICRKLKSLGKMVVDLGGFFFIGDVFINLPIACFVGAALRMLFLLRWSANVVLSITNFWYFTIIFSIFYQLLGTTLEIVFINFYRVLICFHYILLLFPITIQIRLQLLMDYLH